MSATRILSYWDTRPYQHIASVHHAGDKLTVCFEDGACVDVDPRPLLPDDIGEPRWSDLTWTIHEVVIPTSDGEAEISWLALRLATDPAFSAHWEAMAAEEDRFVGERIATLRRERGLSLEELAKQADVPVNRLVRIEEGQRGEATLPVLERVLGAMGASFDALRVESVASA